MITGLLLLLVVIPWFAAGRLTMAPGTQIAIAPADVSSARNRDMALVRGDDFVVQECCAHSASAVDPQTTRYEVRYDDPKVKGSLRSELRFRSTGFHVPTTYEAEVRPNGPWTDPGELVIPMQWHAQKDLWLGEPGRYPPLEFAIKDGRWAIIKSYNTSLFTAPWDKTVQRETLATAPFVPGRWTKWKIVAEWAADETGRIDVWLDGEQIASDRGPNAYRDAVGPYWKLGTYRPRLAENVAPAVPIAIDFRGVTLTVAD